MSADVQDCSWWQTLDDIRELDGDGNRPSCSEHDRRRLDAARFATGAHWSLKSMRTLVEERER